MKPRTGDHWGSIRVIDVRDELVKIERRGGYDTMRAEMLDLKCDCENEWTIWMSEFQKLGRRGLRDCGCGASGTERGASISVYVRRPAILKAHQEEARRLNLTLSNHVNKLMEAAVPRKKKNGGKG